MPFKFRTHTVSLNFCINSHLLRWCWVCVFCFVIPVSTFILYVGLLWYAWFLLPRCSGGRWGEGLKEGDVRRRGGNGKGKGIMENGKGENEKRTRGRD